MSLLFYWILESKYTWLARNSSFLICTIIGGIGSEYVQHYISPFRTFDYYDILVNVCGSLTAIIISDIYRIFFLKSKDEDELQGDEGIALNEIV